MFPIVALTKGVSPSGKLIGVAIFVLFGALCLYLATRSVYVDSEGISVANPFRTRRLRWSDVAGLSVDRYRFYPKIGVIDLKDGTRIHMWALQGPNPVGQPKDRTAELLVDELNEWLRAWRHHALRPPPPR